MAFGPLDAMMHVQQQGELGRERGMENKFRSLTAGALNGDMAAQQQQVAINPAAAAQVLSAGDAQAKKLRGAAKYLADALKSGNPAQVQGAWTTVSPYLAKTTGKPAPPQWDPSFAPGLEQVLAQTAYLDTMNVSGASSGFREFEMTAAAAGLKPGTPEYQQAANIALGREGRAATGGFSFEMMKGADGRERPARRDPRTGAVEIYDESTGSFLPLGQGGQLGGSPAASAMPASPGARGNPLPQGGVKPVIEQIMASANQMIAQGVAEPQVDAWVQSQMNPGASGGNQFATSSVIAPAPSGLGVSRTPEEEAAMKRAAESSVDMQYLPQTEAIKTDAAIRRAQEEARVKADAERQSLDATRSRDAGGTLDLLTEAEALLAGATGSGAGSARDRTAGFFGISTEGAQATAGLRAIAGQLTSKMPRMQGPQSDKDVQLYKEMAGDLANDTLPVPTRMSALRTIRSLNEKYAGGQGSQTSLRRVQSADDYNALPSGAEYTAPDGTVRRKR